MPDAKRVLVVDDEALLRQVMVCMLEEAGFAVDEAADGQQAIDCLRRSTAVDLVLLDIGLPGVDGWGVLAYIATMPVRPHVIIQTGRGEVIPPGHLGPLVSGFLLKPYTGSQLLLTCETALAASPVVPAGGARGEERRNFIVEVTMLSEAGTPIGNARLVQLSRKGFRVELDPRATVGPSVSVAFRLPNCRDTLVLTGRVAWREGRFLGAVMESLAPAHEECLRDLIEA